MTFVWHDANDTSEALRKRDEHERIKGEDTRNRNEAERISAENTRKTKETERIMKENERQEYYSNTVIPLVGEVQQYEEVKDNVENAKTGFDGKEYLSLKHRLDADYSEVKEQFNANTYLPFEGQNITIENSLDGVTKDIEIRGRTLHNLLIKKYSQWEPTNKWWNATGNIAYELTGKTITVVNNSTKTINFQFSNLDGSYNTQYIIQANTKYKIIVSNTQKYRGIIGTNVSGWENTAADKHMFDNSIIALEGDWINKEVPSYFTGIKSVAEEEINLLEESQILDAYIGGNDGRTFTLGANTSTAVIPCEPNTTYTIVKEKVTDRYYAGTKDSSIVNGDKLTILPEGDSSKLSLTVTTPSNARYLAVYLTKNTSSEPVGRVGIYKSVSSFQWSPYNKAKVSILSHGKNMVEFLEVGGIYGSNGGDYNSKAYLRSNYMNLVNIDSLGIVNNIDDIDISTNLIYFYDINKNGISYKSLGGNATVNVPKGTVYCRVELKSLSAVDISSKVNRQKLMVGKGIRTETPYELYKSDKKEILLNQPLRGLPNINDRIFERNEKVLLEQNIGKVVIDGRTTPSILDQFSNESTICFYISVQHSAYGLPQYPNKAWGEGNYVPISDKFIFNLNILSSESVQRSFGLINAQPNYVCFRVPKTEIGSDLSAESIRSYMQNNPVTIYYKLPIPIITELDISTIELRTLLGRTHIMSLNKILSMSSFKAPVDVPATISTLKARNEKLKQENEKLKENQIITTETLINILEPMMLPEDGDIDDNYLFNRLVESLKRLKG